jgi:hypothetical protein
MRVLEQLELEAYLSKPGFRRARLRNARIDDLAFLSLRHVHSGISNFSISKSALCRRETNMMARMKLRISRVKWWYQHLGCTLFNTPWHIRREDLGLHAPCAGCLKDAAIAQSWVGSSH